jgi:spermidine synthase
MSARLEELAFALTPIGEVSLRRRVDPLSGVDIFEVKLGDEFLMSSLFTAAEIALSRIGLARLGGDALDVVVGGLGLGYTAARALEDSRVRELRVVELLEPVIDWHVRGLVPVGPTLTADARCMFQQGDFFGMTLGEGYDPARPGRLFDAVLLDIDHSPRHVLADGSAGFYGLGGMRGIASHLAPGGVYAMWSNDPPDNEYVAILNQVFDDVDAEVITFPNPLQGRDATATVYVGTHRAG